MNKMIKLMAKDALGGVKEFLQMAGALVLMAAVIFGGGGIIAWVLGSIYSYWLHLPFEYDEIWSMGGCATFILFFGFGFCLVMIEAKRSFVTYFEVLKERVKWECS